MFRYVMRTCNVGAVPKLTKDYYGEVLKWSLPNVSELAEREETVDIRVVCYVRTTRNNKVMTRFNSGKTLLYTGTVESDNFFMFSEMGDLFVKDLFDKVFVLPDDANFIASLSTGLHVFPLGAFSLEGFPYVCYNLIVPDQMVGYTHEDYRWSHIQNLTESSPLFDAIKDTLVITKGE